MLLMHTDARDQHGQDLPHIIEHLGVNDGQVLLSTNKIDAANLASMYTLHCSKIGRAFPPDAEISL